MTGMTMPPPIVNPTKPACEQPDSLSDKYLEQRGVEPCGQECPLCGGGRYDYGGFQQDSIDIGDGGYELKPGSAFNFPTEPEQLNSVTKFPWEF